MAHGFMDWINWQDGTTTLKCAADGCEWVETIDTRLARNLAKLHLCEPHNETKGK